MEIIQHQFTSHLTIYSHSFPANVRWDLANAHPPVHPSSKKKTPTSLRFPHLYWLVVSTPLKNISQIGNLPQVGVNIKNISNHHQVYHCPCPLPDKCPIQVIFRGRFVRPTIQHVCTTSPEVAAEAVAKCGSFEGTKNCTFKAATLEAKGPLEVSWIIYYLIWMLSRNTWPR